MSVRVRFVNAPKVIDRFERMKTAMRRNAQRIVVRGQGIMYDKAREYTSLTDHSLADLARLGHPYARRFAPNYLHPDYLVHQQSGMLTSGLRKDAIVEAPEGVIRGVVRNVTWYDPYVQLGTYKMRPRPYMAQVRIDTEGEIKSAAANALRDAVRGNVSVYTALETTGEPTP